MKNFTPAEERAEIERLARIICKATMPAGLDPDTLVFSGEPLRVPGGYVAGSQWAAPAWSTYTPAAKALFDDARRQEELTEGVQNDV